MPAVGEKSRRPAASSASAVKGVKAAMTVLPASAPSHQSPETIMANRLSISVPRAMLAYTLWGRNVIRPCWKNSFGACRWYSRTSKSKGGNMPANRIANTKGTANQSQCGLRIGPQDGLPHSTV